MSLERFTHWQSTIAVTGAHVAESVPPGALHGRTWTRHPGGGREMLCHVFRGTEPEELRFFRHFPPSRTRLPDFRYAVRQWIRIEEALNTPVIIDWHVAGGDWYVHGVSPLTHRADVSADRVLEDSLPRYPFLFELGDLSELAPHPAPLIQSVLERLTQGENHAIVRGYAALGFVYGTAPMYRTVGSELYVDREAELANLLPSFSLVEQADFKPKWRRMNGAMTTLRNIDTTRALEPATLLDRIEAELRSELAAELPQALSDLLPQLDRALVLSTRIDICASKALTLLQREVKGTSLPLIALLNAELEHGELRRAPPAPVGVLGNGWQLTQEALYPASLSRSRHHSVSAIWSKLPAGTQRQVVLRLLSVERAMQLREWSRWQISRLNHRLHTCAAEQLRLALLPAELAPFARLEELERSSLSIALLQQRADAWRLAQIQSVPPRLSHSATMAQVPLATSLSGGTGSGQLIKAADLARTSGPVIVCTHALHVDLLPHLGRINGIITASGTPLSYVAVIARCRHIPVVVHPLALAAITPGAVAHVNGDTSEVRLSTQTLRTRA